MGRVAVSITKPDNSAPTGWSGLISDIFEYSVTRNLNQAGSWSATFPATSHQADQVRAGWRIGLKEERMNTFLDPNYNPLGAPEWVLQNGRVLDRAYRLDGSGAGVLTLSGESWLGGFADLMVKGTLDFKFDSGWSPNVILSRLAQLVSQITPNEGFFGPSVSFPSAKTGSTWNLGIAFSDQTILSTMLKIAELTRTNLTETWSSGTWTFYDQDDVPNSDNGAIYFVQTERADPSQAPNEGLGPGQFNIGVIQGLPTVSYSGSNVVNRIIAVGTDYDGAALTLQNATYTRPLYTPHTGTSVLTGLTSTPWYYIEDTTSQAMYGIKELQLVRSDIKNPTNSPTTLAEAKSCLLALAANELLRRRSETQNISVQVVNGSELALLPGQKVHIRYNGKATLVDGSTTWLDIDQWMLVSSRTDSGSSSGARLVTFNLTLPVIQYNVPGVPTGTLSVPTPLPRDQQNPPSPDSNSDNGSGSGSGDGGDGGQQPSVPGGGANGPSKHFGPLADQVKNLTQNNGAYQPCCADPTTDIKKGLVGPHDGIWWTSFGSVVIDYQKDWGVALGFNTTPAVVADAVITSVGTIPAFAQDGTAFTIHVASVQPLSNAASVTADSLTWFHANGIIDTANPPAAALTKDVFTYTQTGDTPDLEVNAHASVSVPIGSDVKIAGLAYTGNAVPPSGETFFDPHAWDSLTSGAVPALATQTSDIVSIEIHMPTPFVGTFTYCAYASATTLTLP